MEDELEHEGGRMEGRKKWKENEEKNEKKRSETVS